MKHSWRLVTALLMGFFVLTKTELCSGETNDPWSFDIDPYLWLASYEGTFGLPAVPPDIPPIHSNSESPFSTHISGAAMLAAQVHYNQVGLFLDGAWLRMKTEGDSGSSLYSGTEIKSDIAYGSAALSYRLPQFANLQCDLFAGARVWYFGNTIDFESGAAPGFTAEGSRTWVDPIVGAALRYDVTPHWFGTVLGDAGGFGAGSDLTWNVFGGVGYQFTTCFSASLGYRFLHLDYNKDQFEANVDVRGFLVQMGIHF
jgi:hypothetical protein